MYYSFKYPEFQITHNAGVLRSRTNLPRQEPLSAKPVIIPTKAIGRLGITTPGQAFCKHISAEQYKSQASAVFEVCYVFTPQLWLPSNICNKLVFVLDHFQLLGLHVYSSTSIDLVRYPEFLCCNIGVVLSKWDISVYQEMA